MKLTRWIPLVVCSILLLGCGKSSKLAAFLPDAPEGWAVDGGATNRDVSGVGHSSSRSYVPAGNNAATGIKRVTVQILLAEKGADQKKLMEMSLESKFEFKEKKLIAGVFAFESLPLPDNEYHSLYLLPKPGTYVQIVAYKGGPGWENGENRHAVASTFAGKVDLKKLAALE
ncbi:MAG TPA: hypothetical protein VGK21_03005 [Candidatus Angelobacter sp.]|jgi:hypothetical protein